MDMLVNNAGITRDQLMLRMKREDWDAVLATNLTAAFACAQAVLQADGEAAVGRIVNVTSVVGQAGNAGQANYAASKAGPDRVHQGAGARGGVAQHHGECRGAGLIDTDMTRAIAAEAQEAWAAKIPLQRLGTPEDVAGAVAFLASDEAAYITGHVLAVNGGMYM